MADNDLDLETHDRDADAPAGAISPPDSVASRAENAELEHTQGGVTTRSDLTDAGVPMLPGDPAEPIGPEDAMGPGPKRGDYSGRIDAGPHLASEPIPMAEREPSVRYVDENGNDVDAGADNATAVPTEQPRARLVDQSMRATEQGEDPGKGGVTGSVPREDVAAGAGSNA